MAGHLFPEIVRQGLIDKILDAIDVTGVLELYSGAPSKKVGRSHSQLFPLAAPLETPRIGIASQITDEMETIDTIDAPLSRVEQPNGALEIRGARTEFLSKQDLIKARRLKEAQKAYGRGRAVDVKSVKDKKLRRNLTTLETKYKEATLKAKEAEILLENESGFLEPEHELERTYKVRQDDITNDVGIATAHKRFEIKLEELGPYRFDYSRNGRDLLVAGRKGHIATMEWREGKLGCELQLGETIRDARWLHNNQYFAVAQKKYVYIYDSNGVELHCLRKHVEVSHMEFLPYHFLLATLVSALVQIPQSPPTNTNRAPTACSSTKTPLPARS